MVWGDVEEQGMLIMAMSTSNGGAKTARREVLSVDADDNTKALNQVSRPASCMCTTVAWAWVNPT